MMGYNSVTDNGDPYSFV